MNEREIFLAALDLNDESARLAYVRDACRGNGALQASVEALLKSHQGGDSFLRTPAPQQLVGDAGGGPGRAESPHGEGNLPATHLSSEFAPLPAAEESDDLPLDFLEPSSNPDSLGVLNHYEVLEVLGRGAFGIVFKAFDEKLQRAVAIKVMSPELAATSPARKRFLREARAAAAIRHENVIQIYAVENEPLPYLVMEFVPGRTLQQRLDEEGPLDLPDVLRLARQIAEGLTAAHERGLVHRDIKPSNVLLDASLEERVKITDFGLARAVDDASMTRSGVIAGTPMYMAPEQALGKKLDQRADLFSLGSVLYQMVTGRPPFRAPSTLAVLKRVTDEAPRPIQEVIPETPGWLCTIVSRLMTKDPDRRLSPASEVAGLLERCWQALQQGVTPAIDEHGAPQPLGATVSRPTKEQMADVGKPGSRYWLAPAAVALLLTMILAIGGIFIALPYLFPPPAPQPAWTSFPPGVSLPPLAPLDDHRDDELRRLWRTHLERAEREYGKQSVEFASVQRYWGLIQKDIALLNEVKEIESTQLGAPSYQTLSILGYLHYDKNNFPTAQTYLTQSCAAYESGDNRLPVRAEENPYLWLAQVEYFLGVPSDQRARTLGRAVGLHKEALPIPGTEWYAIAQSFRKSGELDLAELCYRVTISKKPAAVLFSDLVRVYSKKGWVPLALESSRMSESLRANPWRSLEIAWTNSAVGDFAGALPHVEGGSRVLKNDRGPRAWTAAMHGLLLNQLGEEEASRPLFETAVEFFDRCLRNEITVVSPSKDRAVFVVACVNSSADVAPSRLVSLGEEAVSRSEEIEFFLSMSSLGLALENAGDVDRAIRCYEQALLNWRFGNAPSYFGRVWVEQRLFDLYEQTGRISEALEMLPRFVQSRDERSYRKHPVTALFRIWAVEWLIEQQPEHPLVSRYLSEAKQILAFYPDVSKRVQGQINKLEERVASPSE